MPPQELDTPSGRETRLLAIVIVVSIAVLLLLARFRFPAATLNDVTPGPGPLAGLAARAAFDEMATSMSTLLDRVAPSIAMMQIEAVPATEPPARAGQTSGARSRGRTSEVATTVASLADASRYVPALRLRADLGVVYVPPGMRIASETGAPGYAVTSTPTADPSVTLVSLSSAGSSGGVAALEGFAGVRYVGVIGAAASGPTIQPVFIGRVDEIADANWPKPLMAIPGSGDVAVGSFVFTIDGRLIGMAIREAGAPAIVPASALLALAAPTDRRPGSPP